MDHFFVPPLSIFQFPGQALKLTDEQLLRVIRSYLGVEPMDKLRYGDTCSLPPVLFDVSVSHLQRNGQTNSQSGVTQIEFLASSTAPPVQIKLLDQFILVGGRYGLQDLSRASLQTCVILRMSIR